MDSNLLVGLDIGTTKVCAVVGTFNMNNELEILGVGIVPSKGLRKGVIINIENASKAISSALANAEIQSGIEPRSVFIGISGGHIEGLNSKGVIAVNDRNREIDEEDMARAVGAANAIVIPVDREIIHVIPQEYIVDDQDGIKSPKGMSGSRLEVIVHIITAATTSLNNLIKSVNKAGYEVEYTVLEPLAASQTVLTEEEKELGVALVDIGGGTSDFVLFSEGSLRHTGIISVGGNNITNDIAYGFRTPNHSAEKIKIDYGAAIADFVGIDEEIEVPGLGGRAPRIEKRRTLIEIIQPRIEEILDLIDQKLEQSGEKDFLAGGVVLTGGVALTPYITELASEIFQLPVRIGRPLGIKGLNDMVDSPVYSTAVGLALYTHNNMPKITASSSEDEGANIKGVIGKLGDWFKEFF